MLCQLGSPVEQLDLLLQDMSSLVFANMPTPVPAQVQASHNLLHEGLAPWLHRQASTQQQGTSSAEHSLGVEWYSHMLGALHLNTFR